MSAPPTDNKDTWRRLGWILSGMLAGWLSLSPQPIASNHDLELLRAELDRLDAKVRQLEAAGQYRPLAE